MPVQNLQAETRTGATYAVGQAREGGSADASASAVAWPAILGGAFVAAAATLILMALGAGLGLSTLSPWPSLGASTTSLGIAAIIWLVVTQWLSSAFGGYLTGRLRTKWVGLHSDEVFFRDTAHGLLAWAVATVIAVAFLASAVTATVSGGARAVGSAASSAAQATTGTGDPSAYLIDALFRAAPATGGTAGGSPEEVRGEATRILATGLRQGDLSGADRTYLAQLVAANTGLSEADAATRVDGIVAQAKDAATKAREAADAARKATASLAIITSLAMVIGAFVAAAAGALGGHHRDQPAT
jgi:hypothetical protein